MVLVPMDTPGITILRDPEVLGFNPWESHVEMEFDDVRVPTDNLHGEEGSGFAMTQARLGPGRIHHCMRQVGAAERALSLFMERAEQRTTFGTPLIVGLLQDVPLSHMYANARVLRIADGPDEVHARALARTETRRHAEARRLDEPVLPLELVSR